MTTLDDSLTPPRIAVWRVLHAQQHLDPGQPVPFPYGMTVGAISVAAKIPPSQAQQALDLMLCDDHVTFSQQQYETIAPGARSMPVSRWWLTPDGIDHALQLVASGRLR